MKKRKEKNKISMRFYTKALSEEQVIKEIYNKEAEKTIVNLIDDCGGIKAFADRFNFVYRTVQSWHDRKSKPAQGVKELIAWAIKRGYQAK